MKAAEIPDEIYEKITALSEEGNQLAEEELHTAALEKFTKAYELIPEPKFSWDTTLWTLAAIGDMRFQLKDYSGALDALKEACKCPGGVENPFVLLRLGQSYLEKGDEKSAADYLIRAYMLAGEDIFEGGESYLEFLKAKAKL